MQATIAIEPRVQKCHLAWTYAHAYAGMSFPLKWAQNSGTLPISYPHLYTALLAPVSGLEATRAAGALLMWNLFLSALLERAIVEIVA